MHGVHENHVSPCYSNVSQAVFRVTNDTFYFCLTMISYISELLQYYIVFTLPGPYRWSLLARYVIAWNWTDSPRGQTLCVTQRLTFCVIGQSSKATELPVRTSAVPCPTYTLTYPSYKTRQRILGRKVS